MASSQSGLTPSRTEVLDLGSLPISRPPKYMRYQIPAPWNFSLAPRCSHSQFFDNRPHHLNFHRKFHLNATSNNKTDDIPPAIPNFLIPHKRLINRTLQTSCRTCKESCVQSWDRC